MAENNSVQAGLLAVQRDLRVPKENYNSFAKYKFRSAEDITEKARPLCNENGLNLTLSDEVIECSKLMYIKATARVTDIADGSYEECYGMAGIPMDKKGCDISQAFGMASSYARKYALNGLFALDDTKDADTNEAHIQATKASKPEPIPQSITQEQATDLNLEKIKAEVNRLGINFKVVSNIIKRQFHRDKYAELNTIQQTTLLTNLEKWSKES